MAVNNLVDGRFQRSPSVALVRDLHAQHARLSETLVAILGSRSRLDAVAARSYWHPNGFAKVVLDRRRRSGEVRLHIWPRHPHDEDIHGHAWKYESIVLAGELTEAAYRESESGEDDAMWRHSYRRVGAQQFAFGAARAVHLTAVGVPSVHVVGDLSRRKHDHIHRFFASKTPAATLLRVGPSLSPTSSVYRRTAEPPPIRTPRPTSGDELRQWLGFVADLVDG